MPSLVRHLRALVIAIAVLALSATVVLGARGLPSLAAALTGSGTTADATGADDQGEDADDQGEDTGAPDEDAPETAAPETEAPETDAPETDAPGTAEAGDQADNHGAMVSQAAGMETPAGFANHGAFVSCVARQNHGHLAPGATPIPLDQLTPADCAKDAEDASDGDASTPDAAPTTSEKVKGKSASAHDKAPKSHGHGKGHGH